MIKGFKRAARCVCFHPHGNSGCRSSLSSGVSTRCTRDVLGQQNLKPAEEEVIDAVADRDESGATSAVSVVAIRSSRFDNRRCGYSARTHRSVASGRCARRNLRSDDLEPLRAGAFVEAGDLLVPLDPGTRPIALAEAKAASCAKPQRACPKPKPASPKPRPPDRGRDQRQRRRAPVARRICLRNPRGTSHGIGRNRACRRSIGQSVG